MRIYTVLLLGASMLGYAQPPPAAPPADVDQALRAQAAAFLKYQMEGNFRKAYELVAEDSKDYYLGLTKDKSVSADIEKIEYSDDFTKAAVFSASKMVAIMVVPPIEVPSSKIDLWRLEDRQWKWYHDPSKDVTVRMFGPMGAVPGDSSPGGTPPQVPKELGPHALAAAAAKIGPPKATINRSSVSFPVSREATEDVVYHNNGNGFIRVEADLISDYPDFEVEPKKVLLNPQADAIFKVTYHPSGKGIFKATLLLTVQPFEREYRIPLTLLHEPAALKP